MNDVLRYCTEYSPTPTPTPTPTPNPHQVGDVLRYCSEYRMQLAGSGSENSILTTVSHYHTPSRVRVRVREQHPHHGQSLPHS